MIVHRILAHRVPKLTEAQQSKRFQGETGSDSHKMYIFERTVKNNTIKKGEHVIWKRNQYQVIHVDDELTDYVQWDGLSAQILTLWDGGDEMFSVHPNQVKRKKR